MRKAQNDSGSRQRNARGKGDRLREEVLSAAMRLLATLAPGTPLSLRSVAQEAGVAAPSIYRHFATLDDLIVSVMIALFEDLAAERDRAEADAAQSGGDAWERLLARSLAYVRFGLSRPGAYQLLYEGTAASRLSDPALAACGDAMTVRTAELLDDLGVDERDRRPRATRLWAALHGIVSIHIHRPGLPMEPADMQTRAMLEALVPRGRGD